MLALKIIGIIALIIFLICMITVGVDINYVDKKFSLSLKCCGMLIQIFPKKKKSGKSKPKKEKKPKEEKPEKPKKEKKGKKKDKPKKKLSLNFSGEEILGLLKKVIKGFKKFNHGFNVDRFLFDYVATGKDPYDTAKRFAYVNAVISAVGPLCKERFRCKDLSVRTDIDFTCEEFVLDFGIAIVLRIGAIFRMINTILFGALGIIISNKVRWIWMKLFRKQEYLEEKAICDERSEKISALLEKVKSKKENPEEASAEGEPSESAA